MATPLDVGFLQNFSDIFIWILVFTVTYAVQLVTKKPFGDNKGINALIAFSVSTIFILVPDVKDILVAAVPWWILILLLTVFLMLSLETFGNPLITVMESYGTWILIAAILAFVFAWAGVAGQKAGPYLEGANASSITQAAATGRGDGTVASGSFQDNLGATLFHPKVLGMILVLAIALFAVLMITYPIKLIP
ncbi:MAG: hypothetical protein KKF44_01960 [Nanoarchaeota archaeon]|nr:hypothetical protein [Nanoarchaeota archaeon]